MADIDPGNCPKGVWIFFNEGVFLYYLEKKVLIKYPYEKDLISLLFFHYFVQPTKKSKSKRSVPRDYSELLLGNCCLRSDFMSQACISRTIIHRRLKYVRVRFLLPLQNLAGKQYGITFFQCKYNFCHTTRSVCETFASNHRRLFPGRNIKQVCAIFWHFASSLQGTFYLIKIET